MDHRDPSAREETFLASWEFHLRYRTHPGCVYHLLPGLAEHYGLDEPGRAWLAWVNGNPQNPVTEMLLLEVTGGPNAGWDKDVAFGTEHFRGLGRDPDPRQQKSKHGA